MNKPTPQGILAIWHDLKPSSEAESQNLCELEFQEWHFRQHMRERLSIPGFVRGCRYVSVESSSTENSTPLVFNYYITESPEVLTCDHYLKLLNNPTEWSTRVMPSLQNVVRSAGRVVVSLGHGQGGAIATLRVSPLPDKQPQFEDWFTTHGLQHLLKQPGIVAVHLWKADLAASSVKTVESRARTNSPDMTDWAIAIEGNDVEFVRSASEWLQDQNDFTEKLQQKVKAGIYRLQHHLNTP